MGLFSEERLDQIESTEISKDRKHCILIVDDEASNLAALSAVLGDQYEVIQAADGIEALEKIKEIDADSTLSMIISDQRMPGMSGAELLEQSLQLTPSAIRMILTAFSDVDAVIDSINKARIYRFIVKPFERRELLLTVKRALEAFELDQELDEYHRSLEHKVKERTAEVHEKNEALARANAKLEKANLELARIASFDVLTGLCNRRHLLESIEADVARSLQVDRSIAENLRGTDLAFLLIDIDHFKHVNDTYGHAAGDLVLVEFAVILERECRAEDMVVRWGGEEFLIVSRQADRRDLPGFAERLRCAIANAEFQVAVDTTVPVTCSIGYASLPFLEHEPEVVSWEQVVAIADQAMYTVKRSGRNGWLGLLSGDLESATGLSSRLRDDPRSLVTEGGIEIESSIPSDRLVWTVAP